MMRTTFLAMLVVATSCVSTAAQKMIVEMAPNQGCVLLVGFFIKTKDADSTTELLVNPYCSWPVCGFGSTPPEKYLTYSWDTKGRNFDKSILVMYAGMAPFNDKTKALKDFPLCIRGPKQFSVSGHDAFVKPEDQAIGLDGTYYWYSSDALYNVTVPKGEIQPHFLDFPENGQLLQQHELMISHKVDDKTHLDSTVFSNTDLLNILPNPYGDQIQQAGFFQPDDWASKTFTVQLPSATAAPQAKRTMNTSRRRLGRV